MANNKITNVMVAVMLGGAFAAGTITSCDDDDGVNVVVTTGRGGVTGSAGAGGRAGSGGSGGTGTATGGGGGGPVTITTYNMNLNGASEVPANASPATAAVRVTLDQANGDVVVDGTFTGLTTPVTAAHIHGPAAAGANAAIIVPLTITGTTSGTITGTGNMNSGQMNDMLTGMTYVNIHSSMYPSGEIRAQIQ